MHRLILIALYGFLILLLIDRILISIDYQTAWQGTYVARYMLNIGGIVLLVYMFLKFKVNRLEGYILIGTFCYALGGLGTRLAQDTSPVWDDGLVYHQLGVLFELLFFSMGLAYKFRLDAIDKERYMLENQRLELERALSLANLRNQIAQDIHDEIGAGLTKISLAAQFSLRLPNLTMTDVREKIKRLETETRHLAAKLREIVFAINPEYDNFEDMQDYFRDAAQQFWAETDVKLVFDFPKRATKHTVAPDVKRHLLLIFTEMQNNIAKHAHATQVDLTLKMVSTTQYTLSIKDNGCGFTPLPKESGQVRKNGFSKGLSGMKSRAESIKADFYIVSEQGHGTTITVQGTF